MDIQNILFYVFAAVSSVYVVHFGLYLIGANFYDIWQYRRQHRRRLNHAPPSPSGECAATIRPQRRYPAVVPGLVTIAISAHNEEKVIVRSLDSIRLSQYQLYEVIVADDSSADRTELLIRDYIRRHPDMRLQVYRMRKNVGKGAALATVLRRYGRGEFAMTLDADSLIKPDTISNALTYFDDPCIAGVAANVQVIDEPTILGILQKFEHMIGYRSKKLYSIAGCEFVVGGVASTYRMNVLRAVNFYDNDTQTEDIGLSTKITSLGNRRFRLVYAADVVAMTEGVLSFKSLAKQRYRWKYGSLQNLIKYYWLIGNPSRRFTRTLTMYRMPMAVVSEFMLLISPLAWSYALYMTLTQYNPQLVIGAYATITAYMLVTIWLDENISRKDRLRLTLYAPTAYFVFYLMDLVQLTAVIRCLLRSPALIRRKDVKGTWVSPQRSGKPMVVLRES